jgi:type IV pilus assembly protein PilY1
MQPNPATTVRLDAALIGLTLALGAAWPAAATTTDLANLPVPNATSTKVLPNIYYILDDSGSMAWRMLPAALEPDLPRNLDTGHWTSSHCNGLAYNPEITYAKPASYGSKQYADANFASACGDGYSGCWRGTDLSGSSYYRYTGAQPDLDFQYRAGGGLDTSTAFYRECNATGNNSGFTEVKLTAASPEATNYANWYSYYRTRINMMKSVIGQAFADIRGTPVPYGTDPADADYFHARVGFTGIWNNSGKPRLAIAAFEGAQKKNFYDYLYAASPDNSTPTRTALEAAGRMYETDKSVIQYSCQRNYALLSSDGYWNSYAGRPSVGDVDGSAEPPQKDAYRAPNTMADVAYYYYRRDLRPDLADNVPPTVADTTNKYCDVAKWQHMTTLTLGLGISGTLAFNSDYRDATCAAPTDTSTDYYKIANGTKNWPAPADDTPMAVDDLWHAAVNGRGVYFNASDPRKLKSSLKQALAFMQSAPGSGAASATDGTKPADGTTYAYSTSYLVPQWTGDVIKGTVDVRGKYNKIEPTAAAVLKTTIAANGYSARNIFTGSKTNVPFAPASFTTADERAAFALSQLTQYKEDWSSAEKLSYGSHWEHLVNYLRGDSSYEMRTGATAQLFRKRDSVLGDIVHAQPIPLGGPGFSYADSGYAEWKAAHATRPAAVLVGANDGMVHAFNASSLRESWAYVPPMVIPRLWRLADRDYATAHRFYVDGPLALQDAQIDGQWHSVLVGALGKGGRGYFALQIDDADVNATPKLLWTFSADDDPNMGYTYGTAQIAKLKDGTWVAVLASGYNNVPELAEDKVTTKYGSADGKGRLYIRKLSDGKAIRTIETGVGSVATPSGLASINVRHKNAGDYTALGAYGGDLYGNMWRFDLETGTASKLIELGSKQPITAAPDIALVNNSPVVYFGTGSYLGRSDTENTDQQSFYAVKDDGSTTVTTAKLQKQTIDASDQLTSYTPVNWATQFGWYFDFPHSGERLNISPQVHLGVVVIATAVPTSGTSDAALCGTGGKGELYQLSNRDGGSVDGNPIVGSHLDGIPVGITVIDTRKDGEGPVTVKTGLADGNTHEDKLAQPKTGSSTGKPSRVQWRQLLK